MGKSRGSFPGSSNCMSQGPGAVSWYLEKLKVGLGGLCLAQGQSVIRLKAGELAEARWCGAW